MSGLYLHIPFCRKACHYCNFHFSTQLNNVDAFVEAIVKEIFLEAKYLPNPKLESIYFGGGSPSILSEKQLSRIFDAIKLNFRLKNIQEITLETNPEDIDLSNLKLWKEMGINRLSIGIQSLNDDELKWMNRSHNKDQSLNAVEKARKAGFDNLSIDLIYGSEKKSLNQWKTELEWANKCGANHISCYALTIEEKTPFGKWVKNNKMAIPKDEHSEIQFQYLSNWAIKNQWEHYEISNLCKPGHRAVHNSNYWSAKPYLGLGPSAHSFNGHSRRWNVANNAVYVQNLDTDQRIWEEEILSDKDILNEFLLTQLRLKTGVSLSKLEILYPGYGTIQQKTIDALIAKRQINIVEDRLVIPVNSKFLADAITVELMIAN